MHILKKLRKKAGLTVRAAAKLAGIPPSSAFSFEKAPRGHVAFTRYVLVLKTAANLTDEEFVAALNALKKKK